MAALGGALVGFYLPDLFVSNMIQRRQESIMRAFPDALDLLLICVESGMSIESAFTKVAAEIGSHRRNWPRNWGSPRPSCPICPTAARPSTISPSAAAIPASRRWRPRSTRPKNTARRMGQALRVTAQENREMRMQEAEKKAAALPAKLTVPMILFFLPCLFVVILGPAIMKVMSTLHH